MPLTVLGRGDRARLHDCGTEEADRSMLRALGLRPDCEFRVCRTGETCILAVGSGGGRCRIGVSRQIAERVMVCRAESA